jgi:type IV pilus assembly protein PilP
MKAAIHSSLLRHLTPLTFIVLLCGCVTKDMSDLDNYADKVLARKGGEIKPLPPIKPYERYLYRAAELGLRDPFRSFIEEERKVEQVGQITDARQQEYANEVMTHNREELEGHELDTLRMVGVLENVDNLWGIIRDPQGTVHRIRVGNYLGRNYGKVINIQEDRIDVREITKDAQGRYEERGATLALSEE